MNSRSGATMLNPAQIASLHVETANKVPPASDAMVQQQNGQKQLRQVEQNERVLAVDDIANGIDDI
eukprot:CAMPEP_0180814494 /NCGR_PEP_ID=MMETSP1038_2-20121128/67101_1 /TAXON_ID=632150 /ORGANISM="Azadinium spinosum, Strain 3D9" /LENGTH=65 /DNA_ID=CAMNT_0022856161 /DNA_START=861 /DNA_END=1058 /DNA_ORIENTATION=+